MNRSGHALGLSVALLALVTFPPAALRADPAAPALVFAPSVQKALEEILRRQGDAPGPRILALGEYHETNQDARKKGRGAVPSALRHFIDELLPALSPQSSDLILETWITDGNCGKAESAAVGDVKKTTERPAKTEDELVTLVKQAKAAGVLPHILKLSCTDYQELIGSGEVDYDKLLKLITELLQKKITAVVARRTGEGSAKRVLVYGGAVHNDLSPKPELVAYSFGPALKQEYGARYVELDLYVPEFIERDQSLTQASFYLEYKKRVRPGQAAVVERAPGSFILIFPRRGKR